MPMIGWQNRLIPQFLRKSGRAEFVLLGTLCLIAGIVLGFGILTEEVLEGDTGGFDRVILLALRTPEDLAVPIGPRWLAQSAVDITALGGVPVLSLISVIVVGYLMIVHRTRMAALVLVAAAGGTAISFSLKLLFERARPDLVPHHVATYTSSFPSSHAMMSAMIYLTLGALLARVQTHSGARVYIMAMALVLTLIVGTSRVYLGVHWPTDILAGWCVGSAWAMLCWTVARWLQRRRKLATPQDEPV